MDPVKPAKNPRGRPRDGHELKTSVTTWVPTQLHDRLCRMAASRDVSVSSLVKTMLSVQLHDRK